MDELKFSEGSPFSKLCLDKQLKIEKERKKLNIKIDELINITSSYNKSSHDEFVRQILYLNKKKTDLDLEFLNVRQDMYEEKNE